MKVVLSLTPAQLLTRAALLDTYKYIYIIIVISLTNVDLLTITDVLLMDP